MPGFDFHCHPTLKPRFVKKGEEPSPWVFLDVKYKVGKVFGNEVKISINKLVNEVLNSQSNLSQLCGRVNLIGLILHAPESNIGRGLLERKMVSDGKLDLLNAAKLKVIQKGDHYFKWMKEELEFLKNNLTPPADVIGLPAGAQFKILNSAAGFNEHDLNTVHGFIVVEGLHCFFNNPDSINAFDEFHKNFNSFIAENKVFAVNITHLQSMPFSNHASGMQFLNEGYFFPTKNSISDRGVDVIDHIYSNNILIDIKHMSFIARTRFYALRSEKGYTQPIICTHAGLTGISVNDRLKYLRNKVEAKGEVWQVNHLKKLGHVPHAAFNMTSINLYDEDIVQILMSDGLIGISLDQRILGFPTEHIAYKWNGFPYDNEFISRFETAAFFGPGNPANLPENADADNTLSGDDAMNQEQFTDLVHAHYFMNHVIHILKVAKEAGIGYDKAKTMICLGSDFDGLINAIDCCKDCTQFEDFKDTLRRITDNNLFWQNTGFSKNDIDMNELLELIFYRNGVNFVMKHL
jgi:microsomal dipeptidase-like Zn-dependent dipeptidase